MHCIKCKNPINDMVIKGMCLSCVREMLDRYSDMETTLVKAQEELSQVRAHQEVLMGDLRRLSRKLQEAHPTMVATEPYRMTPEKYAAVVARLGQDTDASIADEFSIRYNTVRDMRQRYNIPAYDPFRDLWPEVDKFIFNLSLRALESKYGIGRGRLAGRRKKLLEMKEKLKIDATANNE